MKYTMNLSAMPFSCMPIFPKPNNYHLFNPFSMLKRKYTINRYVTDLLDIFTQHLSSVGPQIEEIEESAKSTLGTRMVK